MEAGYETWIREAGRAASPKELLRVREQAAAAVQFGGEVDSPLRLNRFWNDLHDAGIRRVAEVCVQEMAARGEGDPPAPFAVVLFGSGAREEQAVWSDQDNGLIIGTDAEPEAWRPFFESYGRLLVDRLAEAGYPPCDGRVTANNPQWVKSAAEWKDQIARWLADGSWESIRHALIVTDLRAIYGEPGMAREIAACLRNWVHGNPELHAAFLRNTLKYKVSLNALGMPLRLRYGERAGGVEVKYNAYIPLVNGVRYLALKFGCSAVSTQERLRQLKESGYVDGSLVESWQGVFEEALSLRLMTSVERANGKDGGLSGGYIDQAHVDRAKLRHLKSVLRAGAHMQRFLAGGGFRRGEST